MSPVVELVVVLFAAGMVGLLWAPLVLLAIRRSRSGGAPIRSLIRTWAVFGINGVALAVIAFLAVFLIPR